MNRTISVIIPVYNVEKYLPECMESVLGQSYRDLEILLIDDGSTDNSGVLCDTYAEKDSRVHVIHQRNGGAAAAKNAGLRVATGYYLAFLDSDDYLEDGAYEYMVAQLEEHHADVIQCAYCDVYVDRQEDRFTMSEKQEFSTQEYLQRYTIDWTCGLMTDKLFKRALYDGIFFEEGHKIDDEYFTYQGILNAQKVVYVPRVVYYYRKRKSSVMLSPESAEQILLDRLDYTVKRREKINSRFQELKPNFDIHYVNIILILSKDSHVTKTAMKEIKRKIKAFLSENPKPQLSLRDKILLKLVQYGFVHHKKVTVEKNYENNQRQLFE